MYKDKKVSYLVPVNGGKEGVVKQGFESLFKSNRAVDIIDEMIICYNDKDDFFTPFKKEVEKFFEITWDTPKTDFVYKGIPISLVKVPQEITDRYKNSAIEKNRLYANSTGDILVFADPEIYYPGEELFSLVADAYVLSQENTGYAFVQPEKVTLGTPKDATQTFSAVPWWYVSTITRKLYRTVGGLDNAYSEQGSWGSEDDDFLLRIRALGDYHRFTAGVHIYHLPHPRVIDFEGHGQFNKEELERRRNLFFEKKLSPYSSQLQKNVKWADTLKW